MTILSEQEVADLARAPRARVTRPRKTDDGISTASVTVTAATGGQPLSLLAAAQVLTATRISTGRRLSKAQAAQVGKDGSAWQNEAWALLDEVGELWFAGQWLSSALSRVRIVAAKQSLNGEEPRILGGTNADLAYDGIATNEPADIGENPASTTTQDDDTDTQVAEMVARFAGGIAGQEQFLARAGWHLGIAGDTYLVARADKNKQGNDPLGTDLDDLIWMPYSNEELTYSEQGWRLTDTTGTNTVPDLLPADTLVIRAWRPHPRRFRQAASAVRSALPILRELRGLTQHVGAQIDSRLAGAGLLLLPQSMTFPSSTQAGDFADGEDPFVAALMEAMITPIKDRDSAAAIVPVVVKVPDESLGKAQYLRFGDTALDATAKSLREEAIKRLALSLDIPQEIVTGMGEGNHWSSWQIEEAAVKLHVAPIAAVLCHALTVGWLHPVLEEMGVENPEDYLVWFDTTPLVLRPDRSKDAKDLYDRSAIGGAALRRETGFAETDAPSDDERRELLLIRIVERAPTLAPVVLPLLGIEITDQQILQGRDTVLAISGIDPNDPAAAAALEGGAKDPIRDARQITADERQAVTDARDRGTPDRPAQGGGSPSISASGGRPAGCAVDPALLEGCHVAVLRALEYAGKRMVFGSRKQQTELRELQTAHPYRMHMIVPVGTRELDHLLEGAWTCLSAAREDDCTTLQPILDNYVRLLLEHQVEHSRDYLRAALQQAGVCADAE